MPRNKGIGYKRKRKAVPSAPNEVTADKEDDPEEKEPEKPEFDAEVVEEGQLVVSHVVPALLELTLTLAGVALVHGDDFEAVFWKLGPRIVRLTLPHGEARAHATRCEE